MNKRLAKSAIAIGVGLWLSGTALAAPVDIANTRPFALNAGGLASVQSHLDTLYGTGVLDAMGDQSSAAQWQITGGGIGGIGPILQFQSGAYSASVGFGIWSATDTSSITKTLIFSGTQGPGATATVTWAAGSPGTAIIDSSDNALDGSYAGINRTRFGFYIDSPDGIFYSADQLNPGGLAQMVAYNKLPENNWALFYEDLNCSVGCDGNFVDMVVTSESMVAAVPEPETYAMLLAGLGLMGFVARRRQRKLAAVA